MGAFPYLMAFYLILYVGVIGSGMYSRNAQILSRSCKKEFEKSFVRGTESLQDFQRKHSCYILYIRCASAGVIFYLSLPTAIIKTICRVIVWVCEAVPAWTGNMSLVAVPVGNIVSDILRPHVELALTFATGVQEWVAWSISYLQQGTTAWAIYGYMGYSAHILRS